MRRWLWTALEVAGALVVLVGVVWMFRERITDAMLFHPGRGQPRTPAAVGLEHEAIGLTADDGIRTQAWWIPGDGTGPVIVFFHGNAGVMADRLENARALTELGTSVFMPEYRGYGDSEGRPSERGLYADAVAALREAERRAGNRPVIAFGRSLGGAVAAHAAARIPIDGLVLESTFTSLAEMARIVLPLPGAGKLPPYRFDTLGTIRKLSIPVLILHGDADELIPFRMGAALARSAPEAILHRVVGGTHNDTWLVGGEPYWNAWAEFIERVERS